MNSFNIIGKCISCGISDDGEYLEIEPLVLDDYPSIAVFLDKNLKLSDYEKDLENEDLVYSVNGWLKSNVDNDTLIAVANEITVIRC